MSIRQSETIAQRQVVPEIPTPTTIDGEFKIDLYLQLLQSLTINSRAIITQLSTIAEHHMDHADEICEAIENRIRKCIPQHKLFAVYLLDSICKNIGNPYNIIFGRNIFKIFTETYSIVTDNTTRQSLINLFKTWKEIKTSTGSELFPKELIQKIESFIIQATTLASAGKQPIRLEQEVNFAKLTPDMLLKETKALLVYVINLGRSIDRFGPDLKYLLKEEKDDISNKETRRNQLVGIINNVADSMIADVTGSDQGGDAAVAPNFNGINNLFAQHVRAYHNELSNVRRELDEHSFFQDSFIKKFKQRLEQLSEKRALQQKKREAKQRYREYLESNKVVINTTPTAKFFSGLLSDVSADKDLMTLINGWGKTPVVKASIIVEEKPESEEKEQVNGIENSQGESLEPTPLSDSLGFGSLDFVNSFVPETTELQEQNQVINKPETDEKSNNKYSEDQDNGDSEKSFSHYKVRARSPELVLPSASNRPIVENRDLDENNDEENKIIRPPTPPHHSHSLASHPIESNSQSIDINKYNINAREIANGSSKGPTSPAIISENELPIRVSLSDYNKSKELFTAPSKNKTAVSDLQGKQRKSSLKRPNSQGRGLVKRVRFDV